MLFRFRRSLSILALLGGVLPALFGCGQKGPLYLTDDMGQAPLPLELSEQELEEVQDEIQREAESPRRTTDEALKSQTYDGSLFPSPRR